MPSNRRWKGRRERKKNHRLRPISHRPVPASALLLSSVDDVPDRNSSHLLAVPVSMDLAAADDAPIAKQVRRLRRIVPRLHRFRNTALPRTAREPPSTSCPASGGLPQSLAAPPLPTHRFATPAAHMAFPRPAALDSTAMAHASAPNTPAATATATATSEFGALRIEVHAWRQILQGDTFSSPPCPSKVSPIIRRKDLPLVRCQPGTQGAVEALDVEKIRQA